MTNSTLFSNLTIEDAEMMADAGYAFECNDGVVANIIREMEDYDMYTNYLSGAETVKILNHMTTEERFNFLNTCTVFELKELNDDYGYASVCDNGLVTESYYDYGYDFDMEDELCA